LCTPHFWWQYLNDFPSYKYHLVERASEFKWKYFFEFVPNQIGAFNPFTLGAVIYILFKYKPSDLFERALYFLIFGFIIFFFTMSVRGHVQPQWTIAATIPIIILMNNKKFLDENLFRYVKKYVAGSLILVLILRIIVATPVLPANTEIWGKEAKFRAIEKIAGEKPVIFSGSFQEPSLYTFFTGKPATTVSSMESRQTQFDIWQFDEEWVGIPLFINTISGPKSQKHKIGKQIVSGFFTDSLQTSARLKISFQLKLDTIRYGDSISLQFTISNPSKHDVDFNHHSFPVQVKPFFWGEKGVRDTTGILTKEINLLRRGEKIENQIQFVVPKLEKGKYQLGISCLSLFGHPFNSNFVKVIYADI
jgi:hypothetical protein